MAKLTVDYYSLDEVKGGVQTFFSDFRKIYPDFREVSFLRSTYALNGKLFNVPVGKIPEFDKNMAINMYLDKYEKIFKPEIIVKNSVVMTDFKHRTPTICTIQDNNIIGPKMLFNRGYYDWITYVKMRGFLNMQRLTIKNSDMVIASSEHLKSCYDGNGKDIRVIKNGVDTDLFKPLRGLKKIKEKYGIPDDKKVGISVTDFHPIKGFHIVSHLCKSFPNIFWIIVMKHPTDEKPRLKNVKLLSSIPRKSLAELYSISDFFVLPSAIEGCNVAAIEAMSCNKPVIVSNTGYFWNPEMSKKHNTDDFGIRVNKWDKKSYVRAVRDMMSNLDSFSPRKHVMKNGLNFEKFRKLWKDAIQITINNSKRN